MNTQPEALRLADWLDGHGNGPMDNKHNAAAELRRLHEVNQELLEALNDLAAWNDGEIGSHMDEPYAAKVARAAIAKATGEQA